MGEDGSVRPKWWPEWIPPRCGNGHPQLPGGVASHWVNEPGCPANDGPDGDGRGHHVVTCEAELTCREEHRPEGCLRAAEQ